MKIKKIISRLLVDSIIRSQSLGLIPVLENFDVIIDRPKISEHGDFSTNLPLTLSKVCKMPPKKISEIIVENINSDPSINSIKFAPPGFINFFIDKDYFYEELEKIQNDGLDYFRNNYGKKQNIQIEFVSVNPTGPLHVGHARGAVIGSSLYNILKLSNYNVEREYYINDAGNQMRLFNDSLIERVKETLDENYKVKEISYPGEYVIQLARKIINEHELNTGNVEKIKSLALTDTISEIKNTLEKLNVKFDAWFNESSLLESNFLEKIIKKLSSEDLVYDKDGAKWFKGSNLGLEDDIVVIRSEDGGPTYFGTDLAYHYNKFLVRKFDKVINIWGADHHSHVARIYSILDAFEIDDKKLEIILNQIVNFKNDGDTLKFSKRNNVLVTIDELIEEVGVDACRFIFLSRSPDTQMDFDLKLAKVQSSENPVYYVQYAYARMCSILRTAENKKIDFSNSNLSLLIHDDEINLIKKIVQLPEVILKCCQLRQTHHITNFSMEFAKLLQKFYESCRVISEKVEEKDLSASRLRLVEISRHVLGYTLDIMGMSKPDKM
ncbi:MAG: arginine--tRNA ligase [Chloroflexi bacterium]|nr:arginine--tRNA ligase [Chloroflexota bacterium]|tara:strand:- start:3370 stop:5025 length:1656 start_codon:yes stop_codon:yes gene_type:complete